MDSLALACVAIYIVVDIVYVVASAPFYGAVTKKISGKPLPSGRAAAAIIAYVSMAMGWFFFVPAAVRAWTFGRPWMRGAAAGAVYGLLVYGMFNGTMAAMFDAYDATVVARDMTWGIGWATALSAAYAHLKK
jgi:uncharacterized membrane protein